MKTNNQFPALQRRHFLAGAAVALVVPSAAVAMQPTDYLSELIARHAELRMAFNEAEAKAGVLFNCANRPAWGHVTRAELPAFALPTDRMTINLKIEIDRMIDDRIEERNRHFAWCASGQQEGLTDWQVARLQEEIANAESHRQRLHALYDERQAAYDAWDISSGHRAVSEACFAFLDKMNELESEVFAFRCSTLQQIAAKAAFIISVWGEELRSELQHQFITEVAALVSPENHNAPAMITLEN